MTDNLTCHAGDIVLLRAEIVGVGSDGPYVRVKTGSGRATCLWVPTASVARIERGFDAPNEPNEPTGLSRLDSHAGHLTSRHDELGTRIARFSQS
jgi:hypothetical protein